MRNRAWYWLAGLAATGLLMGVSSVSAAAAAAPGSLDPAFGHGGKVLTDLGVGAGVATDAVLQPNGDIVVSGGFGVARYLPSGALDQTFGTGGLAATGFIGDGDSGTAAAVQPDGKIIWVGSQSNPSFAPGGTFEFAVARFNPNGSLDTSFGAGGRVSAEFFAPPLQGAQEFAAAVLVQPDGKILVGGSARQGQNRFAPIQGALVRYNTNGSLDTSLEPAARSSPAPMAASPRWAGTRRATSSCSRNWRVQPLRPGRRHRDTGADHIQLARRRGHVPAQRPVRGRHGGRRLPP
jgi:uncharacterized delta-60 repeat protein